jgi:hypothetical protein
VPTPSARNKASSRACRWFIKTNIFGVEMIERYYGMHAKRADEISDFPTDLNFTIAGSVSQSHARLDLCRIQELFAHANGHLRTGVEMIERYCRDNG